MHAAYPQYPKGVASAMKNSDKKEIRCFFQQEFYDGKAPVQHALRPDFFTSFSRHVTTTSCSILLPLRAPRHHRLCLHCLDSVLSVHSWNYRKVSHYAKCLQETFLAVHHLLLRGGWHESRSVLVHLLLVFYFDMLLAALSVASGYSDKIKQPW